MGNNITTLAVPWFVLVTTGSPVRTGLTSAVMGIGSALASVLGGPLVDRLGFKRARVLPTWPDADRAGAADRAIAHLASPRWWVRSWPAC